MSDYGIEIYLSLLQINYIYYNFLMFFHLVKGIKYDWI